MTRRRSDDNQPAIVLALREIGANVAILSAVGHGVPDLLVGWAGRNYLLEVKNRTGRGTKLTPDEADFHRDWRGQVAIVTDAYEALEVIQDGGNSR